MDADAVFKQCKDRMDKSVQYYEKELMGIRTGRASTALIEYLKVEAYGSPTDLREIAQVSVPEPTQLMVKPYDPGVKNDIVRAIESADLGLNPMVDGQTIRINVPPPSADRRKQLVGQVKKLAEDTRVAVRNERRDAIKHIDQFAKDKTNSYSEDDAKASKDNIEELTKKHVEQIDKLCETKSKEVEVI